MGPRACGQQRIITVPNGQPNLQLDDRIGRDRAAVPYMAARGQGSRGVTGWMSLADRDGRHCRMRANPSM
jgi:hypothetical protein